MNYPITVELHDFLVASWGHRDKCYLGRLGSYLLVALERPENLKSNLYHIQYEDEQGNALEIPAVWRRESWVHEYTKHQQDKVASELGRQERELVRAQILRIKLAVMQTVGMPEEMAAIFAADTYTNEKRHQVIMCGIGIADIIWPSMMKEYLKSIIPELKKDGIL